MPVLFSQMSNYDKLQPDSPMSEELPILEEDEDEENNQANRTRSNKMKACYKQEPVGGKIEKS